MHVIAIGYALFDFRYTDVGQPPPNFAFLNVASGHIFYLKNHIELFRILRRKIVRAKRKPFFLAIKPEKWKA